MELVTGNAGDRLQVNKALDGLKGSEEAMLVTKN
jgi:hypothetical protein